MPPRNPFQVGKPVAPEHFVGRWPLVEKIAQQLIQDDGPSFAVIGGRRIGKSSLLSVIAHQLRDPKTQATGDWIPLPIYFDFKESNYKSAGEVLARLLAEVRRHTDKAVRRPAKNAWSQLINIDKPWFLELIEKPELKLDELQDCLLEILELLPSPYGEVRLVLLFDEMDEPVEEEWVNELFNQFRSMIYQGDLSAQVSMILAGSERFLIGSEGSPFWNVLTLQYLDAFNDEAVKELAARNDTLSPEMVEIVCANSGGHPFLAQYLLHHAWEEQRTHPGPVTEYDENLIETLASRFRYEEDRHLEGWANAVGLAGLFAYDALLNSTDWVAEKELLAALNDFSLNISRGVHALCYNGLAIHDGHYESYRVAGQLFRTWYEQHRERLQNEMSPEAVASDESRHGQDINVTVAVDATHVDGNQVNVSGEVEGAVVAGDAEQIGDRNTTTKST